MDTTIIVPTFNEGPNIAELVRRAHDSMRGSDYEILFVDDSKDDTPQIIAQVAETAAQPVRWIHREQGVGGLSGAVVEGLRAARGDLCIVMDGDLQHPPELLPTIVSAAQAADVVVGSRRIAGGDDEGLGSLRRRAVSHASTALAKSLFPRRLAACSDPMSGFFAVNRTAVDLDELRPRGFKILMELLCRTDLRVTEVPLRFDRRTGGESKATTSQGVRFLVQLLSLRFGEMARYAVVGAVGAVMNVLIMAMLVVLGVDYLLAAITAAAVTIVANLIAQEQWVFTGLRRFNRRQRVISSLTYNAVDAAARIPVLVLLVSALGWNSIVAQAVTLLVAFLLRYAFHRALVYRPPVRRVVTMGAPAAVPGLVTLPPTGS